MFSRMSGDDNRIPLQSMTRINFLLREYSLQARNGPQVTSPFEPVDERTMVQRIHDRKSKG